jgi:hypothetical protein
MGLICPPLIAQLVSVALSGRAEATAQLSSQQRYAELLLQPGVSLVRTTARTRQELAYSPSFALTGLGMGAAQRSVMHAGRLSFARSYRVGRTSPTASRATGR